MKSIAKTFLTRPIRLFSTFLFSLVFSLVLSFGTLATTPIPLHAQSTAPPKLDYSGFVKCDGVVNKKEPYRNVPCDFTQLIKTVNSAINWIFIISIPVATVLFAYAGLLYITGKPGNLTKANKIFTSVGIGFIIMITAWFVVRTAVDWFVKSDSGATTFLGGK